ncbi:MAG: hypothetical protein MUO40_03065, partial [Anaerolineaceae bacterium]|nr:hypothetical protein [Anaerolineaceae bacterium]
PEVQLGEYKDLRKDYSPEPLDEKRVNDYIYQLRRNSATIVPSEKVAEEGNLVYLTISATSSSTEEGEDQKIIEDQPQQVLIPTVSEEIDTEWPFKGFTRKVIGKNANAEFEVNHKYPKTYDDEKFQGKKVTFTVKVQSIKTLELPELNGEFLKSLGEYETADQFRKDLEERMILDQNNSYDDKYFLELIDQIREVSTIKYPPSVLDKEVDKVLERVQSDLKRQNLDLDTYFKLRKTDRDKFIEEEARPAAVHRLERSLVMDAFAESESLKLDEEKLKSSMTDLMGEIGADGNLAEVQKQMGNENFANAITMEAANRAMNAQIHQLLKQIATGENIQPEVKEKAIKSSAKAKIKSEEVEVNKQPSKPTVKKATKTTKTTKPKTDSSSTVEESPEK